MKGGDYRPKRSIVNPVEKILDFRKGSTPKVKTAQVFLYPAPSSQKLIPRLFPVYQQLAVLGP
jgi:hypothetical protein